MTETEMVWKGPADLRPLLVPVGDLRRHPDNPRRGDVPTIARSLMNFGQLKPIIEHDLDGQRTIFAGNHTWQAAVDNGWTHVAVVSPTYLSPDEAARYLLMDNRSADSATYDFGELTAILTELDNAGRLERTGVTSKELKTMNDEVAAMRAQAIAEQQFQEGRDNDEPDPDPQTPVQPPAALLRQVVLNFKPPETFEVFANQLKALRKEYDTDDVSSTVRRAVERQFEKANQ